MGNLDQSAIMQLAHGGDVEGLRQELRAKCFEPDGGLYYFIKVVLGFKDLEPEFHLPFCNHLQGTILDLKRGYLLPRAHFKSTVMKGYALWRLCGGNAHLRPDITDSRNLRIAFVGEDRDVAAKDLKDPKWHLQNNQLLKWLFPEVAVHDTGQLKWGTYSFNIDRPQSFDEETMTALGVGTKDTGFHYDILIYEDIIGEKASKSETEMKSVIKWFMAAPGLLVHYEKSEELIIGTRWKHGKADLYGYIMAEMPFELPRTDLPEERTQEPKRTFGFKWYIQSAIIKDKTTGEERPAFSSRFTMDALDAIRRREKTYLFSCQYLNHPTAPEGQGFKEEMLKSYTIGEYVADEGPRRGLIIPSDGTPPVRLCDLSRITFYDPSSGGKKANCENAIVAVGCASDKRKFVLAAWSANCGFRQSIEKWFKLNDQFFCWPNYYEAVGAHKEVGLLVFERQKEPECTFCKNFGRSGVRHRRLSPTPIVPPGGAAAEAKYTRILTFAQADIEDGLVYLGPGQFELLKQIIEFPNGEMVDQFDALAYAIHLIRPGITQQEVEDTARTAEKQRDRQPYTQQQHAVGGV